MAQEETQNEATVAETLETPQQETQQQGTSEVENKPQEESPQALRFKTLREARERAEKERDELKQQLERIEQLQAQKNQPQQQQQQQQEDYALGADDLVEGKHLSKYDREINSLKKELENYKQQTTAMSVETKLRSEFSDFDTVVNKENIEILRTAYPQLAAALNSSSDLYNKAASAYTLIKKLGIHSSETYNKEHEKVQENIAKPRPISSLNAKSSSDSPLSHANAFAEGLTKDLKAQLYREMLEAKKQR